MLSLRISLETSSSWNRLSDSSTWNWSHQVLTSRRGLRNSDRFVNVKRHSNMETQKRIGLRCKSDSYEWLRLKEVVVFKLPNLGKLPGLQMNINFYPNGLWKLTVVMFYSCLNLLVYIQSNMSQNSNRSHLSLSVKTSFSEAFIVVFTKLFHILWSPRSPVYVLHFIIE